MAKNIDKIAAGKEKRREREKGFLYLITRCYAVLILAVYPLYVGTEGYNNIIFSKAQVFWGASITFLFIFMLFYLVYRLGLEKEARPPAFWKTMSVPDWAAACFLIIITISCLASSYKSIVWLGETNRNDGWLTYFCMIMAYFALSRWYRPKQLDFTVFAAGSAAVCIIGFLQFYGCDFMKLFPYNETPYADANGLPFFSGFSISFRSTIGNIDFLSAYVCMTVMLFGILYIKTREPVRYFYLAVSAMNFALMVIGGADAGKVGILGAMVLLVPYWLSERKILGRVLTLVSLWGLVYTIHNWILIDKIMPGWGEDAPVQDLYMRQTYSALPLNIIFIISIFALAAGIFLLLPKFSAWPKAKTAQIAGFCLLAVMILGGLAGVEVIGRKVSEDNIVYEARELMHGRMQDHFGSNRGYIWRKALERVKGGQPLFGTGSDTFYHAFGKLNQKESLDIYGVNHNKAHNDFLQILLCNGIFALVSYLALVVGIVVLSVKKAFGDTFLIIALGTALAYLIQSFFGIDTLVVTPIYWIILAVMRGRQMEEA